MENFKRHTYYNTYYYSNIVSNILSGDIELIGFISNFFADEHTVFALAAPYEKCSALHKFIEYMIFEFFENDMHEQDQKTFSYWKMDQRLDPLYAESAQKNYGEVYSFAEFMDGKPLTSYGDIEKYHDELRVTGTLEELYGKIAEEVFYIMFNNREDLLAFNTLAAGYVSEVTVDDLDEAEFEDAKALFAADGVLKRVTPPEWCKKAVFHRDRGRCGSCGCDLTALYNLDNKVHYDHMYPLADGGLNDVSNIQLLCSVCNLKKSNREKYTSDHYQFWY